MLAEVFGLLLVLGVIWSRYGRGATKQTGESYLKWKMRPHNSLQKENAGIKDPKWVFEADRIGLVESIGRSTWKAVQTDKPKQFPFSREVNPNSADLIYRSLREEATSDVKKAKKKTKKKFANAAADGCEYYTKLQQPSGFWPGDYGGPLFLLPGLIIACYVSNTEIGSLRTKEMLKYILNHQNKADGGWGTHIEGESTVFGTVLNYVAARLLGLSKLSDQASKARTFLRANGGALCAPSWAKVYLAILGVFSWDGVNPVPPELYVCPRWLPFHPQRLWCHCRMVYLPMCALYGLRFVYAHADSDPLVIALRQEVYCERYDGINWSATRNWISHTDSYQPQTWIMKAANFVLHYVFESKVARVVLQPLRSYALRLIQEFIDAEDMHTNYIDIGPVNKVFNMLCVYASHGPQSAQFKRHVERVHDYLWLAEDGMKMQGYNGSQLWDTAFAAHAFFWTHQAVGGEIPAVDQALSRINAYLDASQVRSNVHGMDKYARAISAGGWPFSTADHGWPISDCTSEGVRAVFLLDEVCEASMCEERRLEQAVEVIMSMHNKHNAKSNRGWASYEVNRGYTWYEVLNPAEVFGDIMIDYCYVECTSACIQAVVEFALHFPENRANRKALAAVLDGVEFILAQQRDDGSWYGSWAVCFLYSAWFGTSALSIFVRNLHLFDFEQERAALLEEKSLKALHKAASFVMLVQRQSDGSWSESVEACATKVYTEHSSGGQVIQTSWAILALMEAKSAASVLDVDKQLVAGAQFLVSMQTAQGDWPQQAIVGVFNKSCGITYTAYRNIFPIWALAKVSLYLKE